MWAHVWGPWLRNVNRWRNVLKFCSCYVHVHVKFTNFLTLWHPHPHIEFEFRTLTFQYFYRRWLLLPPLVHSWLAFWKACHNRLVLDHTVQWVRTIIATVVHRVSCKASVLTYFWQSRHQVACCWYSHRLTPDVVSTTYFSHLSPQRLTEEIWFFFNHYSYSHMLHNSPKCCYTSSLFSSLVCMLLPDWAKTRMTYPRNVPEHILCRHRCCCCSAYMLQK